jgi:hypothetical protein
MLKNPKNVGNKTNGREYYSLHLNQGTNGEIFIFKTESLIKPYLFDFSRKNSEICRKFQKDIIILFFKIKNTKSQ